MDGKDPATKPAWRNLHCVCFQIWAQVFTEGLGSWVGMNLWSLSVLLVEDPSNALFLEISWVQQGEALDPHYYRHEGTLADLAVFSLAVTHQGEL